MLFQVTRNSISAPFDGDLGYLPGSAWLGRSLAGALVAIGPFEQSVERVRMVVDVGMQVTDLGVPMGHGGDGEVVWVGIGDLGPVHRGRHQTFRSAPH